MQFLVQADDAASLNLQDPIGKQNTTAFFGSAFTRAAPGIPPYFKLGGANVPINQGAQVLSYRWAPLLLASCISRSSFPCHFLQMPCYLVYAWAGNI